MKKYHNSKETARVGKRIRKLRKGNGLSIEDIASMTGFAESTLSTIENGGETDTSHLLEIAKAIGVHPLEIFNIPFEIKPRFKLSPNRQHRNLLTFRIRELHKETIFFNTPKLVSDVIEFLDENYKIKPKPSSVSVVLKRLCHEGKLRYSKVGRKNLYVKKKRK